MSDTSWKDIIGRARTDDFVGREREMEACERFLGSSDKRVLYLHGVGGIGKTTMLRELQSLAESRGWETRWIDANLLSESVLPLEKTLLEGIDDDTPTLIVVDNFEAVAHLEKWLRESLLPELPMNAWLAMAGRVQLSTRWRTNPAWSKLTQQVRLEPFDESDSRVFLDVRGVDSQIHDDIIDMAHGLPIALALAAENASNLRESNSFVPPSDLEDVFERLTQTQMTPEQLEVLRVAGLAWAVTEDVLDVALDDIDAGGMMRWLARRPYMQYIEDGLQPHPVIRRLIDDQFLQANPERRRALLETLQDYYTQQVRHSRERAAVALFEAVYLVRREPGGAFFHIDRAEPIYVDRPRSGDDIARRVEHFEGPKSAKLVSYWMEKHPDLSIAIRAASGELRGFIQTIVLEECTDDERALDPAVEITLSSLDELEGLREGETARMCRFWFDVEHYQDRCPLQIRLFAEIWNALVMPPGASHGPTIHRDPEIWDDAKDRNLEKLAEVHIDEHTYAIYNRDWRRFDAVEHFQKMMTVAKTGAAPTEPLEPRYDVFTHDEFDDAVREALKNFRHAERLQDNALVRSRAVSLSPTERSDPDQVVERLRTVLQDTIESLGDEGGDHTHRQVLRATYIESSDDQRTVADALSMSFSTYRRKLTKAVDRVISRLWTRERHG